MLRCGLLTFDCRVSTAHWTYAGWQAVRARACQVAARVLRRALRPDADQRAVEDAAQRLQLGEDDAGQHPSSGLRRRRTGRVRGTRADATDKDDVVYTPVTVAHRRHRHQMTDRTLYHRLSLQWSKWYRMR